MTGRLFADTNLLIYAMDPEAPEKRRKIADLLRRAFGSGRLVISPQVLNEAHRVLVHKRKLVPAREAAAYLTAYVPVCTAPVDATSYQIATFIEGRYRFKWWDCVITASALQARCEILLTEDLQHGQAIEGMTVVNPFESSASSMNLLN
jgi:predicted nucleic acid-binding protein